MNRLFARPLRSTTRLCGLLLVLLAAPAALAQIADTPQENDFFGQTTITGDFNGDGRDDLVIGVPGECVGSPLCALRAGAAHVIYGTPTGLHDPDNGYWHQNSPGVGNTVHPNDRFSSSFAVGDFDADGFDDLAVGVPYEDYNGLEEVGQVHVLYGSPSGLTGSGSFLLPAIPGAQAFMRLGWSLAVGDFDGNGRDDLAIGIPFYDLGSRGNAGAVAVLFGSNSGITTSGYQVWHQNTPDVNDVAESGDAFGWSLAAGDFDGGGRDDLAIGVPYEDVTSNTVSNGGAVNVLYGTADGLSAAGDQIWSQDSSGIEGGSEANDYFGYALAVGDFNLDGRKDLAIGVPYEDIAETDAGAVNVIYGSIIGLNAVDNQVWHQNAPGVNDINESGDRFGFSLAAGDFDGNGHDDLAVGVPYEDVTSNTVSNGGAVNVLYGATGGLSAAGDQIWSQDSGGIEGGSEANDYFGWSLAAGDFDGNGRGDLAVGVPYEDIVETNAGAVNVIYGANGGLASAGDQVIFQGQNLRTAPDSEVALGVAEGEEELSESADAPVTASGALPEAVALHAVYPNPVRDRATLGFALPEAGPVRLVVYDLLGRSVAVLADGTVEAGEHMAAFDAADLPSGTYLVRLEAGGAVQTQRLTLVR